MSGTDQHRQLRELLGAYALGGLLEGEETGLRAHLDGCASCRAELAEIAPLAQDLRDLDPGTLSADPTPPADLVDRIRAVVAAERELLEARERRAARRAQVQRSSRRTVAAAAAVVLAAAALTGGIALGRSTAPAVQAGPAPTPSSAPSFEQVALRASAGVQAGPATLVPHTWGVEARFEGAGFADGRVYRAAFRGTDGQMVPAGEFLGTGEQVLRCALQSAALREDVTGFVVLDDTGAEVLSADL